MRDCAEHKSRCPVALAALAAIQYAVAMRIVKVAAAQLGPVQKAETRQAVVARMLALLEQAAAQGADLIVYPELALTTFFPRWYYEDRSDAEIWFEREMPSAATRPLFAAAKARGIAMSFGYAEITAEGRHFNRAPVFAPLVS